MFCGDVLAYIFQFLDTKDLLLHCCLVQKTFYNAIFDNVLPWEKKLITIRSDKIEKSLPKLGDKLQQLRITFVSIDCELVTKYCCNVKKLSVHHANHVSLISSMRASLEEVEIYCDMEVVDLSSCKTLAKLRRLCIESIRANLSNLHAPQLEELSLSLPAHWNSCSFPKLKRLSLSGFFDRVVIHENKLQEIFSDTLEDVELDSCSPQNLVPLLGRLQQLKKLRLTHCNFEAAAAPLCECKNLRHFEFVGLSEDTNIFKTMSAPQLYSFRCRILDGINASFEVPFPSIKTLHLTSYRIAPEVMEELRKNNYEELRVKISCN